MDLSVFIMVNHIPKYYKELFFPLYTADTERLITAGPYLCFTPVFVTNPNVKMIVIKKDAEVKLKCISNPLSLQRPSPLARHMPSHSWLMLIK